jgi:long-chain acyl-CoA synthetase
MRVLTPILRRLLLRPDRVRVIDDQRPWRGADLLAGALHVARAIERATERENVGVMLPTSGGFAVTMIATWLLGRTIVPLNFLLRPEELAYVVNDAGLDAVVTAGPLLRLYDVLPSTVRQVRLDELRYRGVPPLRLRRRRPDDFTAAILYTSGTSGRPKGVMLTSANLAANVEQCREWVGFGRGDVLLGVLPQFHSFGLTVLTILPLALGCTAVYTARFAQRRLLELMETHRPSAFLAIPSMYAALLGAKSATPEHFASIRYLVSGSEPLPASVAQEFRDRLRATISEGYGLTETSPVTNWCRPHEYRPRSVGKALPRVSERIVDPDGRDVAQGGEGEIRISGPNVMKGYYNLPEETAAAFDERGYLRTGDMGRFDEEGHLYITGRIKEMLIIGGENVFPREIEEVLNAHPSVKASAVIGVHDPSRGEVPVAFVELQEGQAFDERGLRSHCRERLAQFKVPREIRVLASLPRNATGKILRRQLGPDTPSVAASAHGE